jgi:hypothetical protein
MSRRWDRGDRRNRAPHGDQTSARDGAWLEPEEPRTARERRIARDNRAERTRAALRAASERHGYYVFDELMTEEAGKLDFLAVGPPGAVAIVVRDEGGLVSAAEDGELLLDGRPFDEDPRSQVRELGNDVIARIDRTDGALGTLICFSRAEVEYPDDLELMRGVCTVWTLAWTLDPEDNADLTPADIVELADEVWRVYGRPPFARPAGTGP